MELTDIIRQLADKTEPGRVTDWVERIAHIARVIELPLAEISWNRAPLDVSIDVARQANIMGKIEPLITAIESYGSGE